MPDSVLIEKVTISVGYVPCLDVIRSDYTAPVSSVSAFEPQSNIGTDFFVGQIRIFFLAVTECLNEVRFQIFCHFGILLKTDVSIVTVFVVWTIRSYCKFRSI